MTKDEFIAMYCENSKISREFFDRHFVAMECDCDASNCKGWAAVSNNTLSVKAHEDLYAPKEPLKKDGKTVGHCKIKEDGMAEAIVTDKEIAKDIGGERFHFLSHKESPLPPPANDEEGIDMVKKGFGDK